MNGRMLSRLYQRAHDRMRNVEGLLPQEAFDELLKFLFYKDYTEERQIGNCDAGRHSLVRRSPKLIRETFARSLESHAPWAFQIWRDGHIHLSDQTLLDLQGLFEGVKLANLPLDVRSTALRTFVSPELRKGLGIFLTPENVVRTMVEIVSPKRTDIVLDPACGSGTFLLETVRFLSKKGSQNRPLKVYGIEKSPRMLLLAELNLKNQRELVFEGACTDSLRDFGQTPILGLEPNSVDVIFTNPPFGVTVSQDTGVLDLFDSDHLGLSSEQNKVPSEILFVELCLRMLRPGGRLGIILPRSVLTNERTSRQRNLIDQIGRLTAIIDLPTETFSSMGTQTTTVAAFFRKHSSIEEEEPVSVKVCHVSNVGFDSTGRYRSGDQLPGLAARLAKNDTACEPKVITHSGLSSRETLQSAANLLFRRNGSRNGKTLRDFIEVANTGRTPGRSDYTDDGMFIVKVGNLTGHGIDWEPRDRNFVSSSEARKRTMNDRLRLCRHDILLTSSAHAARYIAKKVDIIARVPESFSYITFVGEVIRVRPRHDVDPYILLATLRHPRVRQDLQASVRGQTAHLNPVDLLEVTVPCDIRSPSQPFLDVADLLRKEADLAFRLSLIALQTTSLLDSANSTFL